MLSRIDGAESALASQRLAVTGFRAAGPAFAGEVSAPKNDSPLPEPKGKSDVRPPQGRENRVDGGMKDDDTPPVLPLLREPAPSTALRGFPLLRDAVAVAKVTAGLLRAERRAGKKRTSS